MKFTPFPYQQFAYEHLIKYSRACLFLEMGLGKTAPTASVINYFMYSDLSINKTLVIAPKQVALNVWGNELSKWDHLQHLRYSIICGDLPNRLAALKREADIYVINRENVAWLVAHLQCSFPFDMVILDELSSFKNPDSKRFKALKMVMPLVKRVVGLTGTPAGNGIADLWPEMFLIDRGERLGKSMEQFKKHYLSYDQYVRGKYEVNEFAKKEIFDRIKDICISMRSEDYQDLPEKKEIVHSIRLSPEVKKRYDNFERDSVLRIIEENDIRDAKDITALQANTLSIKLRQFANGSVYDEDRKSWIVHDEKLDALEELIEGAMGKPILVFYQFRSDLERIVKRFGAVLFEGPKQEQLWNAGKIPLMTAHAKSAGHGLNLQYGGQRVVWFGLTWSLEEFLQANKRVHRQGTTLPVFIYKLVCAGTIDVDMNRRLQEKTEDQDEVLDAVKAIISKYLNKSI